MKYAWYEFVTNVEEKNLRRGQVLEALEKDPDFYSAYFEIPQEYNAPVREMKAIKALKAAIKKGKIRTVVIPSFENFYMAEIRTYNLLTNLMRAGVRIAIGTADNLQTEEDLFEKCLEAQQECVITVLSIPMITMANCRVERGVSAPFIRLEEDCTEDDDTRFPIRMLYADAVMQYRKSGFYLYRSDVEAWCHVSSFMADMMIDTYNINNEIMTDIILQSL